MEEYSSPKTSIADALRMHEARLGPPPSDVAPSGRMNARGISVFYGAISQINAIHDVLALNLDGIVIHEVTGVGFKTAATPVVHYQCKSDAHSSDISHAKSDGTADPEYEF